MWNITRGSLCHLSGPLSLYTSKVSLVSTPLDMQRSALLTFQLIECNNII